MARENSPASRRLQINPREVAQCRAITFVPAVSCGRRYGEAARRGAGADGAGLTFGPESDLTDASPPRKGEQLPAFRRTCFGGCRDAPATVECDAFSAWRRTWPGADRRLLDALFAAAATFRFHRAGANVALDPARCGRVSDSVCRTGERRLPANRCDPVAGDGSVSPGGAGRRLDQRAVAGNRSGLPRDSQPHRTFGTSEGGRTGGASALDVPDSECADDCSRAAN